MPLFLSMAPVLLATGLLWGALDAPDAGSPGAAEPDAVILEGTTEVQGALDPDPVDPLRLQQGPDFSFSRPLISFSFRGGAFLPRAQGQFYDFIFRELTLDSGDLRSFSGGAELGFWVGEYVEFFASLDVTGVTRDVEWRDWEEVVGGTPRPITQTLRLRHGPVFSLGAKAYPLGRGEHLSQFIWTPSRVAPFVSGGVGVMGYEVEQWGDWVVTSPQDPAFGDIFTDEFSHGDNTLLTFLGAGTDVTLTPRLGLTLEGRYIWGEDRMGGDFLAFDRPLDLSGLRLSAGLSYRY
ncbi:MAG: hypothetical protein EA422_01570 [Gemmatimonadales bacterium]|nr:MAG: hypothetical protein EA422_01570 [Gemmatimonadales bacterium]